MPMIADSYRKKMDQELEIARQSRRMGLEGRARVCARRAAGAAIRGFFLAHHLALLNQNVYELLQYCSTLEFLPPRAQESARNLSLRVDEHFHLPPGVDLLEETEKLIQVLESVPMEEMP